MSIPANYIEAEVSGLSSSPKQSAWKKFWKGAKEPVYVVLLKAATPPGRVMAVVVGAFEAQAIAVAVEELQSLRPLTHDLFAKATEQFGYVLEHIVIDRMENEIFSSKMHYKSGDKVVELDARPSDSLIMAVRAKAKMYITEEIFTKYGFVTGK